MNYSKKLLSLFAVLFCLLNANAQAQEKLVVAVQPTLATGEMIEKAKPLQELLEKNLGQKVEIYAPMSYAAVVESLRFGHAQIALMGAWPAKLAVDLAQAELPLAEIRTVMHGQEKTEANYYYSYWIVKKDAAYTKLEELRGKNVCFPSPISTSGYVAPIGHLVDLGLLSHEEGKETDPKSFFGQVVFGGGYQQCWTALTQGQVDVTVTAGDIPAKLYEEIMQQSKILEEQGPIPSHALVLAKGLSPETRSKIISTFEELGKPEHQSLMRNFVSGIFVGFKETTAEEHLKGLNHYLKQTGLKFTEKLG